MKKTPGPKRAGTETADQALAMIGDDPQTLALAIELMDRILAKQHKNRARSNSY